MSIAVYYYTKSGNTKKLADAIAEELGVTAKSVEEPLSEHVDMLFLGSSVYGAGVDEQVKSFLAANKDKIGKIYNFSTAALLPSTYKQVKKLAAVNNVALAKEEFHCKGSFGVMHKGRPNAADLEAAKAFAKSVVG